MLTGFGFAPDCGRDITFLESQTLLKALALGWWISMHGRRPVIVLLLCLLFTPTSSLPQNHALPPPVGGITVTDFISLSQVPPSSALAIANPTATTTASQGDADDPLCSTSILKSRLILRVSGRFGMGLEPNIRG
jgi:hypothetical protein